MRVLIGYSMRSGSTLLQNMLGGHSRITARGDLSSPWTYARACVAPRRHEVLCFKPVDLIYLQRVIDVGPFFDRFVWLARDPRDSYLSTLESGYAYLAWRRGRHERGIDLGLLARWRRIYRHLFSHPERWHLVRYEDLVTRPERALRGVLRHLDLPVEDLVEFGATNRIHGGDYKIHGTTRPHTRSVARHTLQLDAGQQALFREHLGREMRWLGYLSGGGRPALASSSIAAMNSA